MPATITAQAGHVGAYSNNAHLVVPVGAPGRDQVMRVTGWDVTLGDEGVSHMTVQLSPLTPSKPTLPVHLYLYALLKKLGNP